MYELAQFPLQLVAFPGEELNLHIFEPRYKRLINDCQDKQIPFGIPPFINGQLPEFGTKMKLKKIVKKYDDGRMDIQTEGIFVYRIITFSNKTDISQYATASVIDEEIKGQIDYRVHQKILNLLDELYQILRVKKPQMWLDQDVFSIIHKLGLSLEEEYVILSSLEVAERERIICHHLEKILPKIKETEFLRRKIQMNGHFKHIIPPDIS